MPQKRAMLRCGNCGTEWVPNDPLEYSKDREAWTSLCPVCQFQVTADSPTAKRPFTLSELETRLSALLTDARRSGVPPSQTVELLNRELAFAAELAHPGRRILVHIIDMGPQEIDQRVTPVQDRLDHLHSRGYSTN